MTEYTSDRSPVHISPSPTNRFLDAFVTASGDVIGVRSTSHDEVSLEYVNAPHIESFIIDVADLERLVKALSDIADAFRRDGAQ